MKNKLVLTILTVLILAGCASKPETEEEKEPAEVILYQLAQDRICLLYTSDAADDP